MLRPNVPYALSTERNVEKSYLSLLLVTFSVNGQMARRVMTLIQGSKNNTNNNSNKKIKLSIHIDKCNREGR